MQHVVDSSNYLEVSSFPLDTRKSDWWSKISKMTEEKVYDFSFSHRKTNQQVSTHKNAFVKIPEPGSEAEAPRGFSSGEKGPQCKHPSSPALRKLPTRPTPMLPHEEHWGESGSLNNLGSPRNKEEMWGSQQPACGSWWTVYLMAVVPDQKHSQHFSAVLLTYRVEPVVSSSQGIRKQFCPDWVLSQQCGPAMELILYIALSREGGKPAASSSCRISLLGLSNHRKPKE